MTSSCRVAFITGITGQDGSYLAELLLQKDYKVHGLIRRSSTLNTSRVEHLFHHPALKLHYGDMTDGACLYKILNHIKTTHAAMDRLEIYNLAAQSHVKISFEMPEYTADTDAFGTLKLLEAVRNNDLDSITRFYQASTSELYGKVQEMPQRETTPFYPRSPYAVGKLYAYWIVKNYREAYGMHASNGILFNHEGPTRGETFVTRKISRAVAAIKLGFQKKLYLGNIDSYRDWGHARDYVEGMWLMLQQDEPDDYVLATGETQTVREFVNIAFAQVGRPIEWHGKGVDEKGVDAKTGEVLVEIDPRYFRPTEVDFLLGDPTKARTKLGWTHKIGFKQLVEEMVASDLKLVERESHRNDRNA